MRERALEKNSIALDAWQDRGSSEPRRTCLQVAIDAQIMPGAAGGVAPFIACLIHALGQLCDGSEFYTVVVGSPQQASWLQPFLGPNQRTCDQDYADQSRQLALAVSKALLGPLLPAARRIHKLITSHGTGLKCLSQTDSTKALGVMLCILQRRVSSLCSLPTIYNPHDLQHLHYPQFWTPADIAWRETIYPMPGVVLLIR